VSGPRRAEGPDALGAVRFGPGGLVAAVVQDVADGRVLMVGWQDAEALEATLQTGEVHFHSRSRGRLWRKGETSGHTLALVDVQVDCDGDALLIRARPNGPTCHTNERSCFDAEGAGDEREASGADHAPQGFAWLETLWSTIAERARTRPEGSYTTRLLIGGVDAAGRKVVEEATEVLIAAKDDAAAASAGAPRDRAALAGEAADLLYHLLVLCAERGLPPNEVIEVLRARHGR
jgi:phosphoribosyl-AMP cyclohydrolase / phosphoribosyl-ATP pyrophosphohydrolase